MSYEINNQEGYGLFEVVPSGEKNIHNYHTPPGVHWPKFS